MKPMKRCRGRPSNKATDAICADTGFTKQHARRLVKESQETGEPIEDMKAARLRKTKLEGDKLQFQLEVLRGNHIPKAKVEEDGIALGMAVKAQLLSWIGSMPGRLEGLSAAAMVPIFEDEMNKILRTLADAH